MALIYPSIDDLCDVRKIDPEVKTSAKVNRS
jgi:hypothetical protein